jgi:phosphate transport system substrate-binding protein
MKPIRWSLVCGLFVSLLCAGCQPPPRPIRNLVLTGSTCMMPLMRDIGKRFEADRPDVRVDVQPDGSSHGIAETRLGLADIGMVARALKPDEAVLHATPIGYDAVCILVHRSNTVAALRDEQIVRIYTRGVSNWKEVGGPDLPIVLVHMADGRAMLEMFLDHFKLRSTQIRADAIIRDSDQGVQAVATRPGAIAYVSWSHAQTVASDVPIRVMPSNGITATPENVRSGAYPLSRPLQLVTREEPKGLAAEFIDFACSNAVLDLVEKHHFVSLQK